MVAEWLIAYACCVTLCMVWCSWAAARGRRKDYISLVAEFLSCCRAVLSKWSQPGEFRRLRRMCAEWWPACRRPCCHLYPTATLQQPRRHSSSSSSSRPDGPHAQPFRQVKGAAALRHDVACFCAYMHGECCLHVWWVMICLSAAHATGNA
jgi:hypothetical protein